MAIKELEKFDFDEEQEQIDFISLKKSTPVTLIVEDDCVSRRAVLEQIYKWSKDEFLRVAKPFDYLRKRINSLLPVTPQPKIGYWIEHSEIKTDLPDDLIFYECSECGCVQCFYTHSIRIKHFCPHCGIKMRVTNRSEE